MDVIRADLLQTLAYLEDEALEANAVSAAEEGSAQAAGSGSWPQVP